MAASAVCSALDAQTASPVDEGLEAAFSGVAAHDVGVDKAFARDE